MALSVGTRLGPYEILSALGAGGMGEVYRARDTKLNRHVAIKVLPDVFANDPERLARFTARVTFCYTPVAGESCVGRTAVAFPCCSTWSSLCDFITMR
jgi:hypothetical protein